jgi:hypothetical protein
MPASEQVTTVRVESEKGNEILNAFWLRMVENDNNNQAKKTCQLWHFFKFIKLVDIQIFFDLIFVKN